MGRTPSTDTSLEARASEDVLRCRIGELETQLAEQGRQLRVSRDRELRHRRTFDLAGVGIAHVSPDGRFLYVNRRVTEILGYTAEELLSLTFFQITHPDDTPQTLRNHAEMTEDVVPTVSVEKRYLHKDGHAVWVHLIARLVRDTETDEPYYLSILDDISTRKRADEFKAAMEAAQMASQAKSMFLANMSHEIRTPIGGIMGMTDYLLETEITEEQRDCLDIVKSSADALLSIVNDILDISKVEAGRLELERVAFSLRDTMSDALAPMTVQAEHKGITLHWAVRPEVPEQLVGDPGRLRQILLNLVGNAIKFTERGGVRVRVEAVEDGADDVVLQFSVTDTGIGIPPERQREIFSPFEQVNGSTTREYGGTGLGLSIASELVRRMDGSIEVDSHPGAGSTFRFSARFGRAARGAEPPRAPSSGAPVSERSAPIESVPAPSDRSPRILLVDDNEMNQRTTRRVLHRQGYAVTIASDGSRALELAEELDFDLILMDVQMPRMDGLTATRALRRRERESGRHVPVIGLTACAMIGDDDRCRQAGMDGYLGKPYSLQQLYALIEQHISPPPRTSDRGET